MLRYASLPVALALLASGTTLRAQLDDRPCPAHFSELLSDREFARYPARVVQQRPHAPLVQAGEARLYRTVIRDQAKTGPDFAGHFTMIMIGCGAGSVCPAIADTLTGKVYFPPEIRTVSVLMVDAEGVESMNYRRDSRLLIIAGKTNEDSKSAGLRRYVWENGRLRLLNFVRAATLCGLPADTKF